MHHRIYVCDPKKPTRLHTPRSRGSSRNASRGDLTTLAGKGSQSNLAGMGGRGSQGNLQTLAGRGPSQGNLMGLAGSRSNLAGMGGRASQTDLAGLEQRGTAWRPTDVVSLSDVGECWGAELRCRLCCSTCGGPCGGALGVGLCVARANWFLRVHNVSSTCMFLALPCLIRAALPALP